jgi:putative cell wall-binding protein
MELKKEILKKTLTCLITATLAVSMNPLMAMADNGITSTRLFGSDRIGTATNVADTGWTTASSAILAPAADGNLVDALASAPLAGKNMPILLTESNSLSDATRAELTKLNITNVYVVGAIQQTVVDQLNQAGITATPLKGEDRIGTAVAISSHLTSPAGSFVVGYNALADALSVASFAAANNYSILVTNPDGSLPESEKAYLGSNVYIIGGPTLVKDIPGATRLYGMSRFETNEKVLNAFNYTYDKVYVANGADEHLVDSLVASSLAAKTNSPIVLADTNGVISAPALHAKLPANAQVAALGGTTVVTNSVVNQIITGFATPPASSYTAGMYKVGTDMPAGEYVLASNTYAYFEVDKDSTGQFESIITNNFFINRSIITVSNGQYLVLEGCTAYPAANAPSVQPVNGFLPEGMYKVGVDLPAGEYKFVPDAEGGYYAVSTDSSQSFDSIVANEFTSSERYITVQNGQYLELSTGKLQLN